MDNSLNSNNGSAESSESEMSPQKDVGVIQNKESDTFDSSIPQLTEGFTKARRQMALFSGILIGWELVGIELLKDIPIYQNFNVKLKNPEAVKYVIVGLILYFGFRVTIEWFNSHPCRRSTKPSKFDYYSAYIIALISLSVYAYQLMSNARIADVLTKHFKGILSVAIISIIAILLTPVLSPIFLGRILVKGKKLSLLQQISIYVVVVGIFLGIYFLILFWLK